MNYSWGNANSGNGFNNNLLRSVKQMLMLLLKNNKKYRIIFSISFANFSLIARKPIKNCCQSKAIKIVFLVPSHPFYDGFQPYFCSIPYFL